MLNISVLFFLCFVFNCVLLFLFSVNWVLVLFGWVIDRFLIGICYVCLVWVIIEEIGKVNKVLMFGEVRFCCCVYWCIFVFWGWCCMCFLLLKGNSVVFNRIKLEKVIMIWKGSVSIVLMVCLFI